MGMTVKAFSMPSASAIANQIPVICCARQQQPSKFPEPAVRRCVFGSTTVWLAVEFRLEIKAKEHGMRNYSWGQLQSPQFGRAGLCPRRRRLCRHRRRLMLPKDNDGNAFVDYTSVQHAAGGDDVPRRPVRSIPIDTFYEDIFGIELQDGLRYRHDRRLRLRHVPAEVELGYKKAEADNDFRDR